MTNGVSRFFPCAVKFRGFHRVSTNCLHMAVLIESGFDKRREKTLLKRFNCIVYTINADPYPESDSHFDGNFYQLWKRC